MSDTREQIFSFRAVVNRETCLLRLKEVTEELISAHRRLALLSESEMKGKLEAYLSSEEGTVSGRERYASASQMDTSGDILRVKGLIAAYTEERDCLRLILEYECL